MRDAPNNRLECDLGLSPNPLVADYTYEFCVGTSTPADINGDGSVNVTDFGIFAIHFGTSGCFVPGDLNADGTVDVFDYSIFALLFGSNGLGTCSAGAEATASSSGAGAMTALVQSLGYESVAEYCHWLESLPKQDQIAEIAALFELSRESEE